MKSLISMLVLLFSLSAFAQSFPAAGYSDRTQALWPQYEQQGVQFMGEKNMEGIQVRLYLASSAANAINNRAFLVPDANFNQAGLNNFIFDTFASSLSYFRAINPNREIGQLNLVIVDRGGDKGTISEVPIHSRIIELHLVRWHKYFVRNMRNYVHVSSIHEFAHVINYMYSPGESKLHREFTGVMVECLNLIRLYGIDHFKGSYATTFAGRLADINLLASESYSNMSVLRHMAYVLYSNLYNDIYKAPRDARQSSEEFVIAYLMNALDDKQGLDDSFKKAGILDADGNALTFARLREDTRQFLTR